MRLIFECLFANWGWANNWTEKLEISLGLLVCLCLVELDVSINEEDSSTDIEMRFSFSAFRNLKLNPKNKDDLSITYDIKDVVVETRRNSKVKGRKAKGMIAVD